MLNLPANQRVGDIRPLHASTGREVPAAANPFKAPCSIGEIIGAPDVRRLSSAR